MKARKKISFGLSFLQESSTISPMLWFYYAIFAAMSYGTAYAFSERLLHHVSAATLMTFTYVVSLGPFLYFFFRRPEFKEELTALSEPKPMLWLIVIALSNVAANLLVLEAFKLKNATAASVVETAIPIFTALAAFIFFQSVQITVPLIIGGALIFAGLLVIYYGG